MTVGSKCKDPEAGRQVPGVLGIKAGGVESAGDCIGLRV